ncbi:MAG: phospholipase [Bacteroidetes bacterium]|nr:MAG: phospholipase [Bacteroidota bacterium]
MTPSASMKEWLKRIIFFFPFRLFVVQFKKNLVLLLAWVLLFGFITESLASKYGIPYLFLSPEYHGKVGFISFFIVGMCLGAFIMTFNIGSYVTNGSRFPFLATLNRPFLKFSINNIIIPGTFIVTYITTLSIFQYENEYKDFGEICLDVGGLLAGIFLFMNFTYIYFFSTNKNLFMLFNVKRSSDPTETNAKLKSQQQKQRWWLKWILPPIKSARETRVLTYLSGPVKLRLARVSHHYDKSLIIQVFNQNQNNAARFHLILFAALLILGFFKDMEIFEIPAGGSLILFLTLILMIISILHTWLRGWFMAVFLTIIIVGNYYSQFEFFDFSNKAYGLNYEINKAEYSHQAMQMHSNNMDNFVDDRAHTQKILRKWRVKNYMGDAKPKMIFINCSGGGLKSAVWTLAVLQHADGVTSGRLMEQTQLITGSSGGLIGASYFRELFLRSNMGETKQIHRAHYVDNMGKDLLNPIAFSLSINDFLLRFTTFKDGGYTYANDRGIAFERQLDVNTEGILNKRLIDYQVPENASFIPMLILSPSIVNDGRRLLISPQPISYLTQNRSTDKISGNPLIEEIEFMRFFYHQDGDNLSFLSALRMSSTFPYIMPLVSLPSTPVIEVMDAGARDNYGLKTTMKFIHTFSRWLELNTSGIIIIQIRDRPKLAEIKDARRKRTIAQNISTPVGNFYENLFNIQDYTNDQLLYYANQWYNGSIEVIDFELKLYYDEKISLSWHLTNKEKERIKGALMDTKNQDGLRRISELLTPQ